MKHASLQTQRYFVQAAFQLTWAGIIVLALITPRVACALLVGALVSALIARRSFCSLACPVFPVSELLWRGSDRFLKKPWAPPYWLDLVLRSTKYLLLGGAIVWVASTLSTSTKLDAWTLSTAVPSWLWLVLFAVLVGTLFIQNGGCRYLCPVGVPLGLISLISLTRVQRNPAHCVRCNRCSHRCPAWLPVMHLENVRSPECFSCYRCIDNCPAPGALEMRCGTSVVKPWQLGVVVAAVMVVSGVAVLIL